MARDFVQIFVTVEGKERIDFDKKKVRKALRDSGRMIQKEGRRIVSQRAVSQPGDYPGRDTGTLRKSIRLKVSRPGFLVSIAPRMVEGMERFYPAFLHYGVKQGAVRQKDHKKQTISQWRVSPRGNYMVEALQRREVQAKTALANALKESLTAK